VAAEAAGVERANARSGSARKEGTALATLPQDCAVLPGQLWRRFAFFPGDAFGLADGDREFGLLGRQLRRLDDPPRRPISAKYCRTFPGNVMRWTGMRS
jgi:hypothetical protein